MDVDNLHTLGLFQGERVCAGDFWRQISWTVTTERDVGGWDLNNGLRRLRGGKSMIAKGIVGV